MAQVAVIGPSYSTQAVYLHTPLQLDGCFNADHCHSYTGGMHAIALNLAYLGVNTCLISNFGNDDDGQKMLLDLDKAGVMAFSHDTLTQTPTEFIITDGRHLQQLTNMTYDAYPHSSDEIPSLALEKCLWGIINLVDTPLVEQLVRSQPRRHWISYQTVPDEKLLAYFDTVVLPYDDITQTVAESDFNALADRLLSKGLPHLIIDNRAAGVWLYGIAGRQYIPIGGDEDRIYYLGCSQLLTAALVSGCLAGLRYRKALDMALQLVAVKRRVPELICPQLQ